MFYPPFDFEKITYYREPHTKKFKMNQKHFKSLVNFLNNACVFHKRLHFLWSFANN